MNKKMLQDYARVLVQKGVNIQKGEILCISATLGARDLVRYVVEDAYLAGADRVYIDWYDEEIDKLDLTLGEGRKPLAPAAWEVARAQYEVDNKVCSLSIFGGDPELYKDLDPDFMAQISRKRSEVYKFYQDAAMANKIKWCLAAVPDPVWANKMFPDLAPEEALARLSDYIAHTMRLDTPDPVAAWDRHNDNLKRRAKVLNEMDLVRLHYTNGLGTDLWLGLPEGYLFEGGCEYSSEGVLFNPNMPTEEIFSAPNKYDINGKVVASMPLFHNGAKVQDFGFVFEKGRIVDYWAKEGRDVLKGVIETDEGSHYLGEVALVSYDSPISNLQTLFLETLFDENASCHLAIGDAYPSCVQGGLEKDEQQLEALGINNSNEHVDFMIGTADLSIDGVRRDGTTVPIFRNGNFVF